MERNLSCNCTGLLPLSDRSSGWYGRRWGGRRRRRSGSPAGDRGFWLWLANVDAAFEKSTIFNADTGGRDIADQLGFAADIHFVGGFHITLHLAENDDFT